MSAGVPAPEASASRPGTVRVGVAIPAAGVGRRMGGLRKPWLELDGRPLLAHALDPFLAHPGVVAIRVALGPEDASDPPPWLLDADGRVEVVAGGDTRAESVREAIRALPADVDIIVIHDAARPLVTRSMVGLCIEAALGGVGAVVGCPATDTMKQVAPDGRIVGTPDRAGLWHAQTPQAFPAELARRAFEALEDPSSVTDDASVVERVGATVIMVEGSPRNLKVTRPEDLPLAALHLRLARGEAPHGGGTP